MAEVDKKFLPFPPDFIFGTAVSSFQVEGNSGGRNSDWDMLLRERPEIIRPQEVGPQWWLPGKAEEDINRIASLGVTSQRLSLEWARIEPEEGKIDQEALKRYHQMLDHMRQKGITPMVTLNHFTLPDWIARKGSWENRYTAAAFEKYVEVVVAEFGKDVTHWLTINEPGIVVLAGYLVPFFPPQRLGVFAALKARKHMLEAHRLAYKVIKRNDPSSRVSMAFSFRWYRPEGSSNFFERGYAFMANYIDSLNYIDAVKDTLDFIGVNFYTGFYLDLHIIKLIKNLRNPISVPPVLFGEVKKQDAYMSDFLGPIVPDFFLDALRAIHRRYKMPIIITENGVADRRDEYRAFYILTHLVALWKAQSEGVSISQYIHWSTIDNLEWLEGYRQEFGLIHVNAVSGDRTMRKSAKMYEEIIKSKGIDIEKLTKEYIPEKQWEQTERTVKQLLA